MQKVKTIGYAYASSIIAKNLKCYKTGCWFVAVNTSGFGVVLSDIIFFSEDKREVVEFAANLDIPFSKYSMN